MSPTVVACTFRSFNAGTLRRAETPLARKGKCWKTNFQTFFSFWQCCMVYIWEHPINTPFPFGRSCFMVLVMRKGGESKSLAFNLYIGSFPCAQLPGPVHTARLGRVFCVFSLDLCFVCLFVLFDLFVCLHSFMFPWAVESSPLQFLALA